MTRSRNRKDPPRGEDDAEFDMETGSSRVAVRLGTGLTQFAIGYNPFTNTVDGTIGALGVGLAGEYDFDDGRLAGRAFAGAHVGATIEADGDKYGLAANVEVAVEFDSSGNVESVTATTSGTLGAHTVYAEAETEDIEKFSTAVGVQAFGDTAEAEVAFNTARGNTPPELEPQDDSAPSQTPTPSPRPNTPPPSVLNPPPQDDSAPSQTSTPSPRPNTPPPSVLNPPPQDDSAPSQTSTPSPRPNTPPPSVLNPPPQDDSAPGQTPTPSPRPNTPPPSVLNPPPQDDSDSDDGSPGNDGLEGFDLDGTSANPADQESGYTNSMGERLGGGNDGGGNDGGGNDGGGGGGW